MRVTFGRAVCRLPYWDATVYLDGRPIVGKVARASMARGRKWAFRGEPIGSDLDDCAAAKVETILRDAGYVSLA